jgi:hypothetical protein
LRKPRPSSSRVRRTSPPSRRTRRSAAPCSRCRLPGRQPNYRGVQRIVKMRDGLVRPVDRQRVLNEVVGADRQEVELRGTHPSQCGGDFDQPPTSTCG